MRYERADLVIVGGGPVGTFAALLASARGVSTLLVDQGRPRELEPSYFHLFQTQAQLVALTQSGSLLWQEHGPDEAVCRRTRLQLSLDPEDALEPLHHRLAGSGVAVEALELEALCREYPELKSGAGWGLRGSLAGEVLAQGFLEHCWNRLQGVWADTRIELLDLDHEQATAVASDTVFRGKHMLVCAGEATPCLLHQEDYYHQHSCWEQRYPCAEVVDHACQGVEVYRSAGEISVAAADRDALGKTGRWLRSGLLLDGQPPQELRWRESSDRLPVLGPLDFREDIAGVAGLGRQGLAMAPALAERALESLLTEQLWPQELGIERLQSTDEASEKPKPQSGLFGIIGLG